MCVCTYYIYIYKHFIYSKTEYFAPKIGNKSVCFYSTTVN